MPTKIAPEKKIVAIVHLCLEIVGYFWIKIKHLKCFIYILPF